MGIGPYGGVQVLWIVKVGSLEALLASVAPGAVATVDRLVVAVDDNDKDLEFVWLYPVASLGEGESVEVGGLA